MASSILCIKVDWMQTWKSTVNLKNTLLDLVLSNTECHIASQSLTQHRKYLDVPAPKKATKGRGRTGKLSRWVGRKERSKNDYREEIEEEEQLQSEAAYVAQIEADDECEGLKPPLESFSRIDHAVIVMRNNY